MFEARRLRFHADGIRGGRVCGWVFRRDDPRQRLSVLVTGGAGIAEDHVADFYRADVHRAGIGSDGYCGFAIPLGVTAGEIVVACKEPYRILFRGTVAETSASVRLALALGDRLFRIDAAHQLSGWLSSSAKPEERVEISLRVDGKVMGAQKACLYRDDPPAGVVDGFHGFAFAYPTQGRQVELVDSATGHCLHRCRAKA